MTLAEGLANFCVWMIICIVFLYVLIIMYAQRNPDFALWLIEQAEKAEERKQEEERRKNE